MHMSEVPKTNRAYSVARPFQGSETMNSSHSKSQVNGLLSNLPKSALPSTNRILDSNDVSTGDYSRNYDSNHYEEKICIDKRINRTAPKKNRAVCRANVVGDDKVGRRDSSPPEETMIYQSLDVTRFPSSLPRRAPRRKAVIVGISYVLTPDLILRGTCNDAAAMALALINLADFIPEDIILLVDSFPATCYRQDAPGESIRQGDFVPWKNRQPSRQNILLALNWLRSDTLPGDVLLFYFAGHGIQVDDLSGWEGEGYDEAILPMDFYGDEINAITAVMIRNVLLSVVNDVQVTVILDCNGGQTMMDPAGTGRWNFIKGIKQRGVWPFVTDATDKVARAVYDQSAWTDPTMKKRGARPRFVPGAEVTSTQELLDPTLQKPSAQLSSKVKGYLFAAAPWSQSAIEAKISAIRFTPVDNNNSIVTKDRKEKHYAYHGIFTWCFITALQELVIDAVVNNQNKAVSYKKLMADIDRKVKACKTPQGGLQKLDQTPELTFYRAGGGEGRDFFLWPFGGRRKNVSYSHVSPDTCVQLPCYPHEQHYLSIWEAEEQLRQSGENKRRNDPAFMMKPNSSSLASTPAYAYHRETSMQRKYSHVLNSALMGSRIEDALSYGSGTTDGAMRSHNASYSNQHATQQPMMESWQQARLTTATTSTTPRYTRSASMQLKDTSPRIYGVPEPSPRGYVVHDPSPRGYVVPDPSPRGYVVPDTSSFVQDTPSQPVYTRSSIPTYGRSASEIHPGNAIYVDRLPSAQHSHPHNNNRPQYSMESRSISTTTNTTPDYPQSISPNVTRSYMNISKPSNHTINNVSPHSTLVSNTTTELHSMPRQVTRKQDSVITSSLAPVPKGVSMTNINYAHNGNYNMQNSVVMRASNYSGSIASGGLGIKKVAMTFVRN